MSYDAITKEAAALPLTDQLNLLAFLANLVKTNELKKNPLEVKSLKNDYSDTYPKGFFNLFGSDPNFDLEEPKDIPVELDEEVSFE